MAPYEHLGVKIAAEPNSMFPCRPSRLKKAARSATRRLSKPLLRAGGGRFKLEPAGEAPAAPPAPAPAPTLSSLLASTDASERASAFESLAIHEHNTNLVELHLDQVIDALGDRESFRIRASAVACIDTLTDSSSLEPAERADLLMALLEAETDSTVREVAVKALGKLVDGDGGHRQRIAASLITRLRMDPSKPVRNAAAAALAERLEMPTAKEQVPVLLSMLADQASSSSQETTTPPAPPASHRSSSGPPPSHRSSSTSRDAEPQASHRPALTSRSSRSNPLTIAKLAAIRQLDTLPPHLLAKHAQALARVAKHDADSVVRTEAGSLLRRPLVLDDISRRLLANGGESHRQQAATARLMAWHSNDVAQSTARLSAQTERRRHSSAAAMTERGRRNVDDAAAFNRRHGYSASATTRRHSDYVTSAGGGRGGRPAIMETTTEGGNVVQKRCLGDIKENEPAHWPWFTPFEA